MNTKQELVERYIPLANKLAYQKKKSLPRFVDVEELKSAAYLGLVEAASRFDPERGVAFSTFAYPRVFGAIHDYLREQGWGKRTEPKSAVSLDSETSAGEECYLKDTLEAKVESNDDEFIEVVTQNLDKQAKAVLRYYFIDAYSMKEVGAKFGVSESRISQLIKRYKDQIRSDWTASDLRFELAA
jgi:RNA polymerase sigma factor (sigma-70 family)